jgi:hypothetical protein
MCRKEEKSPVAPVLSRSLRHTMSRVCRDSTPPLPQQPKVVTFSFRETSDILTHPAIGVAVQRPVWKENEPNTRN